MPAVRTPSATVAVAVAVLSSLMAFLSVPASAAEPSPAASPPPSKPAAAKPNVIVILSDDVGYGDVGCYGATKVRTPHIDRLAAAGLRFTDGHCPSATCTPTRYALLTGEYAWRRKGTNILPGDAAPIIGPDRTTLASALKSAGYATGAVGKWHLGLGEGPGKTDWNAEIRPGPLEIGFDYAFLIPATGDRVPCVFVEDRRVVGLDPADPIRVAYGKPVGDEPTGRSHPEKLKVRLTHGHDDTIVNGISRIGYMTGGKSARWVDEDIADTLAGKAIGFIERNKERPFFLYFATHDIHVPRVPHARFSGKSGCGIRGDAIEQLDFQVGAVMAALERLKLAENTLVIFSSDNGPVLDDGYADGAVRDLNGHKPGGPLRGGKYSLYEGGTRVPFIVHWPARVKPGVSDALVCQVDLLASLAALTGAKVPDDAAPDSLDTLAALLGESKSGRDHLVEHAAALAIRQGTWKLVPHAGADGSGASKKAAKKADAGPELYDLSADLGETRNVAAEHPDRVKAMAELLEKVKSAGRTPGR
jgi:arylsulfatase A-like enzyme